jgi:hypothetical protein
VLAYSPQLFAQAAAAPAAEPAVDTAAAAEHAAPEDHAEPEAEPAAAEAAPAEPEPAELAPASANHDVGVSRLEVDLRKIQAERDGYSRFWPWFTVSAGAALTLGGTAVGAGYVFGCDGGCSTPALIGIIVATGTLVATLGAIWVVHADADVRDIDSRRYQLEQEIERIRISAKLPNRFDNQASSPLFSMRFTL